MSGTIYTATIVTIISSLLSIIAIEWFSNTIFSWIRLIISLFLRDIYNEIVDYAYWFLIVFITIMANIALTFTHWNGGLKTTYVSLLIILLFYTIDKVIKNFKRGDIDEFENGLDVLDSLLDIGNKLDEDASGRGTFLSAIYKVFTTTILIIFSALIIKVGVICMHVIDNSSLCDKYRICVLKEPEVNTNQTETTEFIDNVLASNLENITSELNNLIETFKNNSKEENDKNFVDFYKKLQQKSVDVRTYTINDVTYFYEKEELVKELEKESIKFSDNKQTEDIILTDYPIFKFGYFEYARGFEINYEYLISQFKPYLSEQWISYLLLMKEQEIDTHTLQPNDDGVDSSYCMKWENKLETFITTYPDFYLKDDIKTEIEGYQESLKSIGLE